MAARDDVRLLIADTDATNEIFSDAEVDTFLSLAGDSRFLAASLAMRSRTADLARVYSVRVGTGGRGMTVSAEEAAKRVLLLADSYAELDAQSVATELQDWSDPDISAIFDQTKQRAFQRETDDTEFE